MFGTTIAPAPTAPTETLITDGSEVTFLQDVIEPSQTVPVIVDFWA
ncbi:MAG: co-chaperone YbbN, partial [Cypionkella sp.]|nr:co-chaperone YbbN [Cypionkella sp.]